MFWECLLYVLYDSEIENEYEYGVRTLSVIG